MELAVIKIIISIVIVVLLAEVSKRVNPLLGGILSGIPLGIGLSVYFIAYSESIGFIVKGIPWGIAGLSSSIMFCFFYLLAGRVFQSRSKLVSMSMSSFLGFLSFFASGYLIRSMELGLISSVIIFLATFILNLIYIRRIRIDCNDKDIRQSQTSFLTLLLRGAMVGIIILLITGVASLVGSEWSGILSSFPSTLYSLLLMLHYEEGNKLFPSVIYGFSYSVSTLAVFYILCWYILPAIGLNRGFLVIYAISLPYLYIFNIVRGKIKTRPEKGIRKKTNEL